VLVENGGFGASAAAPIARKVMDAYLLRQSVSNSSEIAVPESEAAD
jgi:penicillin-binding protein 2